MGGPHSVSVAREDRPDVIMLDLQMPNVDGFTVLRELQADPRTGGIPVIVSTSLAVNAELKARLPPDAKLVSKSAISRDSVAAFLHESVSEASLQ